MMQQASGSARCFRAALVLALASLCACVREARPGYPGYVEAEFVDVGPGFAGRLDSLRVQRGDSVALGAPLGALDSASEEAALRQSRAQLAAAEALLADLRSGRRAPEQDVAQAKLVQAESDEQRSATQLARDEAQLAVGGISQAQLDDVRALHAVSQARVAQFRGELEVARLPGREGQIAAQEAQVAAARAALEQAAWRLDQRALAAPRAGLVFDTLYSEGEWVAFGAPVVRLLPPENLKVRFFVPEPELAGIAPGREVAIECDGCGAAIAARVSYVSSVAEYTPPVIFSNESRSKLVFLVEARPDVAALAPLHPGLPVNVVLR